MVELTRKNQAATFLAFVSDGESLEAARAVAAEKGWGEEHAYKGTIEMAISHLADHPTPQFLLVEVPSAEAAPDLLDKLADVCAPNVKVIVTSHVNEFSFYAWLKDIGIHEYLLEPFTAEQLKKAIEKERGASAQPPEKQPGKLVAFMGTRGGVGTTTIMANLAYLIDKEYKQKIAALDMDIHFGTVAMSFDLEPVRGVMTLFEQPDRVDSLFLDRVTAKYSDGLSLMSAEEPLKNVIATSTEAAAALETVTRDKFRYVFADLPRVLTPVTRHFLERADEVVLVTEPTLLSLRDLIRLSDYLKELRKVPLVVANREGLASKHEIPKKDFEKHYGSEIKIHIPCMMEAFATSSTGEMLIGTTKNSAALAALHRLAEEILGEDAGKAESEQKDKKRLGWRHKEKG